MKKMKQKEKNMCMNQLRKLYNKNKNQYETILQTYLKNVKYITKNCLFCIIVIENIDELIQKLWLHYYQNDNYKDNKNIKYIT